MFSIRVIRVGIVSVIVALVALFLLFFVLARPALAQSPAPGELHVPTLSELTPALLSAIIAAMVSLVFRFIPGARRWFDQLNPDQKQLFMFVVTLVVAGAIGIWNFAHVGVTENSLLTLALTVYAALTSNQTTYAYVKSHAPVEAPQP